jgi:hypothetical protein
MITGHRAGTVSAATLLWLALTLTVAHTLAPRWSRKVGLDIWNLNAAVSNLQTVRDAADRLRVQEEQLRQEFELADGLTALLATGNLSLAAATDLLQPSLQSRPGLEIVFQRPDRPSTMRHLVARYLISRVNRHLADRPLQRVLTVMRLEAEVAAIE